MLRSTANGFVAMFLCATLTGCLFQKQKVPPLPPQAQTPNIYVPPPDEAKLPPMQSDPPPTLTDAKPAAASEAKPKKRVKKPSTPATPVTTAPTSVPAASEPPPSEAATLGALAPGGNSNPREQQEVANKIAAVEKRVGELPGAILDREQKQIAKIRLFLKEASDALKGGDVDGAKILATKADLLVDDVQK